MVSAQHPRFGGSEASRASVGAYRRGGAASIAIATLLATRGEKTMARACVRVPAASRQIWVLAAVVASSTRPTFRWSRGAIGPSYPGRHPLLGSGAPPADRRLRKSPLSPESHQVALPGFCRVRFSPLWALIADSSHAANQLSVPVSASAFCSQKCMSISRYMVAAVLRCSCALTPTPARR